MKYTDFDRIFRDYGLVHTRSIFLEDPWFDTIQLTRRAKKWLIHKLVNWYWVFATRAQDTLTRQYIASAVYTPSYLSLERALSYYGMIPESVFQYTSVTSRKTQSYTILQKNYTYQKIKPSLMFGYDVIDADGYKIRIGQPEKVLLDYFYLHPHIIDPEDFEWLRLNVFTLQELIDQEKLLIYAVKYPKKTQKTIQSLLHYINVWSHAN